MGTHDQAGLQIRLQASELSAWQWAPATEALPLMKPEMVTLLNAATNGSTVYLEHE